MKGRPIVVLLAVLSAGALARAEPTNDRSPQVPTSPPDASPPAPGRTKEVQPGPTTGGGGATTQPQPTGPARADPAAGPEKPATKKAADADKGKPQKEAGWYVGGGYSFNLLNIEYYDIATKDLHFSGQRRDIDRDWAGLADLLTKSKAMGFVEINRKFVNLRNLSAIHDLNDGRGATLTFRDGAILRISAADLQRLIEVIK